MAVTKVNARDWTVEVLAADDITWVEVGGITSIGFDHESQEVDTTDFDSAGTSEHEVMERGRTYTLEGHFLEDPATGARDTGQARVETLGAQVGAASVDSFRITSPGGTVESFAASVRLGSKGGGNNDKTSWAATLKRSGASA